MPDQLTRWADKYWGTTFEVLAPASLAKGDFDTLVVTGSFSKDSWEVLLGLNPMIHARITPLVLHPIVFEKNGPLAGPSGKKTFTNDEIIDFVRTSCRQLKGWTPEEIENKISDFENTARICGWVELKPPVFMPAPASNSRNALG